MWLLDAANNRYGSTNKRGDVGAFGDIERCGNAALTVENVFYRDVLTVDAQEISKPLADQVAAAQVRPSSTPYRVDVRASNNPLSSWTPPALKS